MVDKEIKKIDSAITELVYDKTAIKKAYNYYHKRRDAEQFMHIEENYGIGVPTGVGFNPLVRPHIDRLIGEYLGLEQDLKISCKDSATLDNIMRDKQIAINKGCADYLKRYLQNNIIEVENDNFDKNMVTIDVKYFVDLIDAQQELHVPILCYTDKITGRTWFYMVTDKLLYKYELNKSDEQI